MRPGEHLIGKVNGDEIDQLLLATEKPFDTQLEVVLYLALKTTGRSQENTQALAKALADVVREFFDIDEQRRKR